MELIVPPDPPIGSARFPTLGDQVVDFLEAHAVFGPGDLKGLPYKMAEDWQYVTYRAYEHWPRRHRRAGRRRFQRVNVSIRKGAAKTEFAAIIAFAELHPYAPVRFDGYNRGGSLAPGRAVVDPFIPMLANAKIQVYDLAYGALKYICQNCRTATCPYENCDCEPGECHWCGFDCRGPDCFDVGSERIIRIGADGKADGTAKPVANAPDTNDGGRTTHNTYDETHRLYLPSEKAAVTTMDENLGKRYAQDPWGLAVTTAGEPGQNSVAEDDHFEGEAIARGEVDRPAVFYFHRQADDGWDMDKFGDRVAAIEQASGPDLAARTDVEQLASRWDKPKIDKAYLERVWTNRWLQQGAQAFDIKRWREDLRRPGARIKPGALVTVGFDGSRKLDATGFVVTDIKTGLQQCEGLWERPHNAPDSWEVPELEVNAKRKEIFKRFRVVKMYADPPYWNYTVGEWAAHWPDVIEEFWTNVRRRMYMACEGYEDAITSGAVGHDSHKDGYDGGALTRHIGNAGKHYTNLFVDEASEKKLWILCKLHRQRKIDLCPAAVLSWQARMDVLGDLPKKRGRIGVVRRGGFG